ncbi:hypothetical protein BB560_001612 [Smittium megazygosporum]|uniref:CN hydrolase domain-containing protein n=1 Tax=Smittium megazygosporum TaxID=133381 RepID=A0A2T9ZH41_9FUNG|nr:hypothetical protein BB560_001612 [Smittium megazygosporum]
MNPLKLALIQLKVGANKAANLSNAKNLVLKASQNGANLIVLPECFNSPYGTQFFDQYAEVIDNSKHSETISALSSMAKEAKAYLIGGSIPEREASTGNLFNTSTVYDTRGNLIAKHRKIHLFDIDVPNKIRFIESEVLSPGNSTTSFDTPWGKIGLAICYDVRFPELAMLAARKDKVKLMVYPGAFNMTTGPLHWEALLRARAIDNQIFVAGCGPAQDLSASYHAWGHSTIVGPDGKVLSSCEFEETIVYADLDSKAIDEIRTSIPVYSQRRFDIYPDVSS